MNASYKSHVTENEQVYLTNTLQGDFFKTIKLGNFIKISGAKDFANHKANDNHYQ